MKWAPVISLLQRVKVKDIYHEIVKTILHDKTGFLEKGYLSYEDHLLKPFYFIRAAYHHLCKSMRGLLEFLDILVEDTY